MTDFFGRNDLDIIDLFYERIDYKTSAYGFRIGNKETVRSRTFRGPQNIRDLNFVENTMYGCIDTRMDTVYVKEENLSFINSTVDTVSNLRVLDFVASAFNDVVQVFNQSCNSNAIPVDDPYLSVPKAVRAYQSPMDLYSDYIDNMMEDFLRNYIVGHNKRSDILNFNDYIRNFFAYYNNINIFTPLTFTSFQRSKHSNIFTSGLAIDIAGLPADDDRLKEELFLRNPLHDFFINVCKQHGFFIPHNTPWIMVADILSPAMSKYSSSELIFSSIDMFTKKYVKAYEQDLNLLKQMFLEYYNRFATSFKVETKLDCNCKNKTLKELIFRNPLSAAEYENVYKHDQWVQFYTNVRNIEENQPFSNQMLNQIISRSKTKDSSLDKQQDVGYINEQFRKKYTKRYGGLNETAKRVIKTVEKPKKALKNIGRPKISAINAFAPPERPNRYIPGDDVPVEFTEIYDNGDPRTYTGNAYRVTAPDEE